MKKYAVIDSDNIVYNIVIADSLDVAEKVTGSNCIFISPENDTCNIGKLYSDGSFIDPEEEETPA
jgi:hypothetical protein